MDIFKELGIENVELLATRIQQVNDDILNHGIHFHEDSDSWLLTGYSYGEFYDWDLYFENLYLSYFGVSEYNFTNFKAFMDLQYLNGFIPRTIGRNPSRLFQHFKPFLAQIACMGSKLKNDYSWLLEKADRGLRKLIKNVSYYEQLKMYLDHWFYYMDYDGNGLPVWMDADQTGMDNQYSRAGILREAKCEGVDLACYLYRELQAMSTLAGELGLADDRKAFLRHADELKNLVNRIFWDESEGFYFDRNERNGEKIPVKSVSGFMPLWTGIASKARAERIVKEHLQNPDEFWTTWPVASLSATEPEFEPGNWKGYGCNWRGTTWIPTNYVLFHGLMDYGYREVARELAMKSFKLVFEKNETTREYYNSETGGGLGLNPFWGWSALAFFMPFEFQLNYFPTRIDITEYRKLGTELFGVSIEKLPSW